MKVWFDHQIFSIQRYGGVSRYFVELLHGLRQIQGIEADVIAPAHVNAYLSGNDSHHPLSFALPFPKRGLRYRPALTAPLFSLANWIGSPDVIHETHYMLGSTHLSKRARVVTTCHDMIFEKHPEWVPGSADRAALKRKTFERADAIICISNHTRDDLIEIYPDLESKVATVYHGVDHTPAPDSAPVDLPKPYLLYVGMREGYKNFDAMIKALGRSNLLRENFHLVCFGGGPLSAAERRMSLEAGFPPERIRHYSGSDSLLAYFYKHAAAFVFPSLYEGFGMPLAEAMAQGCPIACSNASCFPEICGDAAVYFDGQDIDDMRNVIETLVGQPRDQTQVALTNRSRHFSWKRCVSETACVYNSII